MRRVAPLIILIIFIHLVVGGCSAGSGKASVDLSDMNAGGKNSLEGDSSGKISNSDAEAGKDKDDPDFSTKRGMDNVAVVIDTVADVFNEADVKSQRVTQAIFNQPVTVLEEKDSWVKVKVVDGYTGWIKSKFIDRNCSSIDSDKYKYKIVISSKTKTVFSQAKGGITIKEVVMGTELYSNNRIDGSYEVDLPGKITGWVSGAGIMELEPGEKIPRTNAEDFVTTAMKFKGTPYLWGGVSANGLDCSGLTYICSRINGINLPRDSKDQSKVGKKVRKDDLKPGDLVFFSTNEDLKDISHVGIYSGNDEFIHAAKGKGYVLISSLEKDYYKKRLAGIRRIF